MDSILNEACELAELGFNVIMLHPEDKRPIFKNWPVIKHRDSSEITKEYKEQLAKFKKPPNIGNILGEFIPKYNGFLIGIDVDIRKSTKVVKDEVLLNLKKILGPNFSKYPSVVSGSELKLSRHIYCISKKPIHTVKYAHSDTRFLDKEGKKHYFWEIDIFSEKKQLVLPPSIHKDTKDKYTWVNKRRLSNIPYVDFSDIIDASKIEKQGYVLENPLVKTDTGDSTQDKILKLPKKTIDKICFCTDDENPDRDRSSLIMDVILSLGYNKFTKDEILDILTRKVYKISEKTLQQNGTLEKAKAWLEPQIEKAFGAIKLQKAKISNDFPVDKKGNIKRCAMSTLLFFKLKEELQNIVRYNIFSKRIEVYKDLPWPSTELDSFKRTWSTDDLKQCKVYLVEKYNYEITTVSLDEIILSLAKTLQYHPIRDYLNALKWDNKQRLDTWLIDYCGAEDNVYVREVSKKVLLAAVRRVFDIGCKFDSVLILEGNQGIGKSSVVSILGGEWFSDSIGDITNKDSISALQGKWVIELSELTPITKAQSEALKSFISRQTDRDRLSYERYSQDYPRQCIFIGTTNSFTYLKDETGARRFWPIKIKDVKLKELSEDRDQLFAEAMAVFNSGDIDLLLSGGQSAELSKSAQEQKRDVDEWEYLIDAFLSTNNIDKIRGIEIWERCFIGDSSKYDMKLQKRIGRILRSLGWEANKKYYQTSGKQVSGFVKKDFMEINYEDKK